MTVFSRSSWRGRSLTAAAVGALALGGGGHAAPAWRLSAHHHSPHHGRDGLGIKPGKIKHVWLIILENKSYDATLHRPEQQHLPVEDAARPGRPAEELLRHRATSASTTTSRWSAARRPSPTPRPTARSTTQFSGSVDTTGFAARPTPTIGQIVSAAGPNAAAGTNGCVYPATVPTLFNQFDAADVSWKGYAQDLGQPRHGQRRRTAPARSSAARRSPRRRRPGARPAQPGQRERDRPVRAQALPVPVVRVDPAVG